MLRFRQLDLFKDFALRLIGETVTVRKVGGETRQLGKPAASPARTTPPLARDPELEATARQLLESAGLNALAHRLRVEWNPRLRTAAGRADYHRVLVSLNPQL